MIWVIWTHSKPSASERLLEESVIPFLREGDHNKVRAEGINSKIPGIIGDGGFVVWISGNGGGGGGVGSNAIFLSAQLEEPTTKRWDITG